MRTLVTAFSLALAITICFSTPSSAAAPGRTATHTPGNPPGEVIPGVVIIKFKSGEMLKPGTGVPASMASLGIAGLTQAFPASSSLLKSQASPEAMGLSRIYFCRVAPDADTRAIAKKLSATNLYEYAEPKYVSRTVAIPNDPDFAGSQKSYFDRMNVPNAWSVVKGSPNVVIATVDGGTYWPHADLVGNLWINPSEDINHNGRFDLGAPPAGDQDGIDQDGDGKIDDVIGWNFANSTGDPRGLASTPNNAAHGTATASQFGAVTDNGVGMSGASWNCRLMPICASGTSDGSIDAGYEGIAFAYQHGARVINCSWSRVGSFSRFEADIVAAAVQAGALIVAAAGNDGTDFDLSPNYPAAYPGVLSVGATNSSSDARAYFSNYGINISAFAPGTSIWGAMTDGSTNNVGSGTSFSTPLVAGLAGLLATQHPGWTPEQITTQIRVTSDSVESSNPDVAGKMGHGRVNFGRAVTESHAGIKVVAASARMSPGKSAFVPGDTVLLSFTVKNILPAAAVNIQFSVESLEPEFTVLDEPVAFSVLNPGDQVVLPELRLKVGALPYPKDAVMKLLWVSNGNERDDFGMVVSAYPEVPPWQSLAEFSFNSLMSVKAISSQIVWGAGPGIVVRSIDGGTTWQDVTGNLPAGMNIYCVTALDAQRGWVGSGDGRLFTTTDGGVSWSVRNYPGTQSPFIDGIVFVDENTGFALGDPPGSGNDRYIVLKTTDGGATWNHIANEPLGTTSEAGWNNSFWWSDPLHGWFGTNVGIIWYTTDGGTTWANASSGGTHSIGVSFGTNLVGVAVHDDGTIRRSNDGGASWLPVSVAGSGWRCVGFAQSSTYAWIAGSDGLQKTTDGGASWHIEYSVPTSIDWQHLSFADTSTGWGVTSFGQVYRRSGSAMVVAIDEPEAPMPREWHLAQNYPNPFNPSTVIAFSLPSASYCTLKVYDILGRDVATLWEGDLQGGEHRFQFDASSLSTGVYFYRLNGPGVGMVRRMLVLR